jgi:hypothetical protein
MHNRQATLATSANSQLVFELLESFRRIGIADTNRSDHVSKHAHAPHVEGFRGGCEEGAVEVTLQRCAARPRVRI